MRRVVVVPAKAKCGCRSCAIGVANRRIELLGVQYAEARRYLDALKRFRWEWDLEVEKNRK
jgi:hypothetical protein